MFFTSESEKSYDMATLSKKLEAECTTLVSVPRQNLLKKVECTSTALGETKKNPIQIKIKCKKSNYSIS